MTLDPTRGAVAVFWFLACVLAFFICQALGFLLLRRPRIRRRTVQPKAAKLGLGRRKPAWVIDEVIRLKALMPGEGCRSVASAFNARNETLGETVGKTFVAEVLKRYAARVLELRKGMKNRKRVQGPRNLIWGMDITFLSTDLLPIPVLGILDHGTRALLNLHPLVDRTTIGVLRMLLVAIEAFGRPRFLRTDNEAIFNSRLMRFALCLLGIRKQTTDPFCPWQNGRIERFFKTLKERLYPWWRNVGVPDEVQVDLDIFEIWYNQARSHQSLAGLTPAMAWSGTTHARKKPRYFNAWDGILTGWIAHG